LAYTAEEAVGHHYMTIFAVLMPFHQQRLAEAIQSSFPNDHLQITDTQWLISSSGTAVDVVKRLGIYDPMNPSGPSTGNAIIFATSSYYGRAPTTTWDWIKSKLESNPSV
jgi:hypothetical protein